MQYLLMLLKILASLLLRNKHEKMIIKVETKKKHNSTSFHIPDQSFQSTEVWWISARKLAPKQLRKDFDTSLSWPIGEFGRERNARVFHQEATSSDSCSSLMIFKFGGPQAVLWLFRRLSSALKKMTFFSLVFTLNYS